MWFTLGVPETETQTTPCAVCAAHGGWQMTRGIDWPTTEIEVNGQTATVHKCCVREAQSAIRVQTDATGPICYRWKASDNCVPNDVMRIAYAFGIVSYPAVEVTAATRAEDTRQFVAQYRAAQAEQPIGAEQRVEARAAFGPGATVVDVISGRTYTT